MSSHAHTHTQEGHCFRELITRFNFCPPCLCAVKVSGRGGKGDIVPHRIPDKDAHDSRFPPGCLIAALCSPDASSKHLLTHAALNRVEPVHKDT